MDYLIISLVSFAAAILTFFSGFGLGTILTPVFAIFFPIELAIGLTGLVHFFNGVFKLLLIGSHAHKEVVIKFGIPAVIAAFAGAWLLLKLSDLGILYSYFWLGRNFSITVVKLIIAVLLVFFSLVELFSLFDHIKFKGRHLLLGGILSGFFGGLSGHQGAFRSAFLIQAGLSKEAFIGTATLIAVFIDLTRLGVYSSFWERGLRDEVNLILCATSAAIAGAYMGRRLLHKITMKLVQRIVAILLLIISILLGMGLI